MLVGQQVYHANDNRYIGVIERIEIQNTYVRWHKGYATWEDNIYLRLVNHDHHIQAFHAMPDQVKTSHGGFVPNYNKPGIAARVAQDAMDDDYRQNPSRSGFGALCRLRRGI